MTKMTKRIIVLGGSFNPPTSAHYKLLLDQWKGENLLGCVLMDVRDRLREESC